MAPHAELTAILWAQNIPQWLHLILSLILGSDGAALVVYTGTSLSCALSSHMCGTGMPEQQTHSQQQCRQQGRVPAASKPYSVQAAAEVGSWQRIRAGGKAWVEWAGDQGGPVVRACEALGGAGALGDRGCMVPAHLHCSSPLFWLGLRSGLGDAQQK